MKRIAYIDVDNLAYEGIKSGATIGNMRILKAFKEKGYDTTIYKIYNKTDSNTDRNSKEIKEFNEIDNIPVKSIEFEISNIKKELIIQNYDIILYCIPSLFFSSNDCELLKTMHTYSRKLILVMADNLYPNKESIDNEKIYNEYVNILQNSKVITLSKFLKNKIKAEMNVESDVVYPNMEINNTNKIEFDTKKYITLINPVEVKGIRLFEKIVEMNPNLKFLIVRGWEETKNYSFNRENVTIMDFQTDITKVWDKTRILLVLSTWHEVYGRVVSEAIMNCCDVICNNIGGIPEAANGMGILVEPLRNYGTETKQIFKDKELKAKSIEISAIINKELKNLSIEKLQKYSKNMIDYIEKNNNYLYEYIEEISNSFGKSEG